MGHYDEQYQQQWIIDEKNRRERLLGNIKETIERLSNDQLHMVDQVSFYADEYLSFFNTIKQIGKSF